MKLRHEVSAEKLRGGFYTPDGLVECCLDRVGRLVGDREELRVLEPSAGDGAFLRGLSRHALGSKVASVTAVEVLPEEAAKTAAFLNGQRWNNDVVRSSVLSWSLASRSEFDVAVGNPPFLRFQFVSDRDKVDLPSVAELLGTQFNGVSNLWIPVFLAALNRLTPGGVFGFVVPSECFTGVSAGVARKWLLAWIDELHIDMFEPGSFPGVLQEVVVVSGRRRKQQALKSAKLSFSEGDSTWTHRISIGPESWTQFLLRKRHVEAMSIVDSLPIVRRLSEVAKFEVSTVTGANSFFTVDPSTARSNKLEPWTIPLLARIRQAPGLIFENEDYRQLVENDEHSLMLDFSEDRPVPSSGKPRQYIEAGVSERFNERYKCRIRSPWYRVPVVLPGELLLSKRSHRFPRVVRNQATAVTTDTIYQGRMIDGQRPEAFVASFHNSTTLLSAEIEGRSFGGGVLELVPSEISRIRVFSLPKMARSLKRLDNIVRMNGADSESLVAATDESLIKANIGLDADILNVIREARLTLMNRRLSRN
jgi:adenine-specific DNA-methyltransferase